MRALDVGDAGGRRGQLEARERAEGLGALHGKIPGEPSFGGRAVEHVARERHHRRERAPRGRELGVAVERVGDDHFARLEPRDLGAERRAVALRHPELAGRHVEEGEREHPPGVARGRPRTHDREQIIVAPGVEQRVLGERAGSHETHHVAPHHALRSALLRLRRVLHLLAHGDAMAQRNEPVEIFVGALDRHAAHRNVAAEMLAALGEHDAERAACDLGVGEEQLVEVAHPVEQQAVGMGRLDLEVLLHHRRDPAEVIGRAPIAGRIERCGSGTVVLGPRRWRRACAGRVFPQVAGTRESHGAGRYQIAGPHFTPAARPPTGAGAPAVRPAALSAGRPIANVGWPAR